MIKNWTKFIASRIRFDIEIMGGKFENNEILSKGWIQRETSFLYLSRYYFLKYHNLKRKVIYILKPKIRKKIIILKTINKTHGFT